MVDGREFVLAWKERKEKLRRLDKVSKRRKDEEEFDGDKYVKKYLITGPVVTITTNGRNNGNTGNDN